MINQPPLLKSMFLSNNVYVQFDVFPTVCLFTVSLIIIVILKVLSWSLNISKNNYSPNDRFLIKFFIKIISLDSSQRVPTPHEPMSPINNNQGLPLANQPPCPKCFFFGFAYSFPMSPIAFSQLT